MGPLKKSLLATGVGGLLLFGTAATAGHIGGLGIASQPFTFDATAFGGSSFSATFIDFSVEAEADQFGCVGPTCAFDETGVAFFGTFRNTLGGPPVVGTGLGTSYQMYATFSGAGTVTANAIGGLDGTFSSFALDVFIDPNIDTTPNSPAPGAPDESKTVSGTADDVLILSGVLDMGGFHLFPGLANGDFDVVFQTTAFDASVWGGDPFDNPPMPKGDFNGVNSTIVGAVAPPLGATDIIISGSGNASVPSPATLALLGMGLIGGAFAGARLRRRQNV